MTNIAGVYRNGVIELLGPPPADWEDGRQVQIPCEQIDLTGDSPEAMAAWQKEFRQIHAMLADDGFYEELQGTLAKNKSEELAFWEASNAKLERLVS